MNTRLAEIVAPSRVRYIKLGEGGSWEKECIEKSIIRIGFGTEQSQRFEFCQSGRWEDLSASFIAEGKTKGTATRFTNEARAFFEDVGSTLWITFSGERLYWGVIDRDKATLHADGNGVWRRIHDGWRCTDLENMELTKDRLSGALTKLTAYRGTSCYLDKARGDYVIRRINGKKTPQVEDAISYSNKMRESAAQLMKLLIPRDFELLVDLVFTTSGWQRVSSVGGARKTVDLDLLLPSTGEQAFVQVKSKTNQKELAEYMDKIGDGPYDRMFYVFHSGKAETDDPRVSVIGPEQLAEMVMDAGLVGWLIRKVS